MDPSLDIPDIKYIKITLFLQREMTGMGWDRKNKKNDLKKKLMILLLTVFTIYSMLPFITEN